MNYIQLDQNYIMNTYKRFPIIIEKAEGNYLYDEQNNKYLDLFTGLGVSILGHRHPDIMDTLYKQADQFLHLCNHFINKPAIELAKMISELTFKGKVFFGNSGTEATETAIKLIHKFFKNQQKEHNGIVVLKGSYHGRTMGAMYLTRQTQVYQDFPVVDFPIYEVSRENIEELRFIFERYNPSAILFEPVLGSGGVFPLSFEYVKEIEALCKKHDSLLCVDEIQTGLGRTCSLFAYQQYGINPDIVLFGKSAGGGLPLSGVIARDMIADSFLPGDHGSTFGPSPVAAALGCTLIDILASSDVMEKGKVLSEFMKNSLNSIQNFHSNSISNIRAIGMMFGISTCLNVEEIQYVKNAMLRSGFLIDVTQGNIIRLLPPLTLTKEEADSFLNAFEVVLTELEK